MIKEKIKTFRDLKVWQKSHAITPKIYETTKSFPADEKFGLTAQLRRSSASVPTNIVEGYRKNSRKEFLHFLNISETSLEETKYHLLPSCDLGYIKDSDYDSLTVQCDEIGWMLNGLQKKLNN